jgi:hypothetical protein
MTTVGYGDVVPKSTLGKIIGSACAIKGLLMLAMPLAIIATKFNAHYQKMKDIQKFNKIFPRKTQNKQLECFIIIYLMAIHKTFVFIVVKSINMQTPTK